MAAANIAVKQLTLWEMWMLHWQWMYHHLHDVCLPLTFLLITVGNITNVEYMCLQDGMCATEVLATNRAALLASLGFFVFIIFRFDTRHPPVPPK